MTFFLILILAVSHSRKYDLIDSTIERIELSIVEWEDHLDDSEELNVKILHFSFLFDVQRFSLSFSRDSFHSRSKEVDQVSN